MPYGTQPCYFDPSTRLLHIQSSHGAWQVRLWPQPTMVHVAGTRVAFQPPLHLELGSVLAPKTPVLVALALAARTVPDEIRNAVIAFAPASEQFAALQVIHDVPELRSLLEERPVLGRIACITAMDPVERQALGTLLRAASGQRARRVALLDWLKLPRAAAFQKALAKAVHPAGWGPEAVRHLADWWQTAPKDVQHLAVISPAQVRVWQAARDRGLDYIVTPQLLEGLQNHSTLGVRNDLCAALDQIAAHAAQTGCTVKPCRSPIDLSHRLLSTTVEQSASQLDGPPASEHLGILPPVTCPSWIEPLGTASAHAREGVEMEHCLDDEQWFRKQSRGLGYAFSVRHSRGRATVWLKATEQPGIFKLDSLRGPLNEPPDLELRHDVLSWMAAHNAWTAHLHHGQPRPMGPAVVVPPAAVSFSANKRSLAITLMRVGRMASIGELEPQNHPVNLDELETTVHALLPPPRTVEQDVREAILPALRATTASGEQLARLVEQLDAAILDGHTVAEHGTTAVLEAIVRAGTVLAMFGDRANTPRAWPAPSATFDPDTAAPIAEDDGMIPF